MIVGAILEKFIKLVADNSVWYYNSRYAEYS